MTEVQGRVTTTDPTSFAGYRVTAAFEEATFFSGGGDAVFVSATRVADVDPVAGNFAFVLPPDKAWRGPLTLTAIIPNGATAGVRTVRPRDLGDVIVLMVTAAVPIAIDPSADPTHGRRERLTGRVLDPDGTGGATGPLVVIWGISPTRAEVDAFPLLIAETTIGGYFADAWPSMELAQAWAVLGGRDKVPVPLDRNRLPHKVVLVTAKATERPEPENDAECPGKTPSPP